ncbi:MAG: UDP-N-acetylmuramyl tripeptide synthase [Acidimicrobiales bacterium]|jgi:UDP-N-acetylmuramyl tripeptide synthase
MKINKVAITGTKGKTTVANVFAEVLQKLDVEKVLLVNTDGHFVNGEQKSTTSDSIATWGMRPTVSPGRYLFEFLHNEQNEGDEFAAVLEASLSSGTTIGTGYPVVSVAAFLNVFDDHIGSSARTELKNRKDLAKLKSFIYTRMKKGSYAVCNADDPLVVKSLKVIPKNKEVQILYFGLQKNIARLLKKKDTKGVLTVIDGEIVYITEESTAVVMAVKDVSWTFDGMYEPSVYNLLAIIAIAVGYYEGIIHERLAEALKDIHPDSRSGRLVRFACKKNITLIADYAHEGESLREIALLSKKIVKTNGRVLGVVRLAHNRSDEHIEKVAKVLALEYDHLVVYDKIDGHWNDPDPEKQRNKKFPKIVGRTSDVLHTAIQKYGGSSQRIVREDEAIAKAAEVAQDGDVVISIVGDDIDRSIGFLKESFEAEILYT